MLPPILDPVNFIDIKEAAAAKETAATDIFNQLFWLGAAGAVSLAVLQNPKKLFDCVRPLSLLAVLGFFCILSAAWATHPDISIRRSLFLVISMYVVVACVAYIPSPLTILRVIYLAFGTVLVLTIASLPFSFAFDDRGLLRGVSGDKNFLGVLAGVALFTGFAWLPHIQGNLGRIVHAGYILGWLCVLLLSGAKAAIALCLIAPAVAFSMTFGTRTFHVSLSTFVLLSACIISTVFFAAVAFLGLDSQNIVGFFSPDPTFTGRDLIWKFCVEQWEKRWLLGFGYGSFWGVGFDSPNLSADYYFIRLLTQSHNGYLDIALGVGTVGLIILGGYIGQIIKLLDIARVRSGALYGFGLVVVIYILLHNCLESSLMRGVSAQWTILLCMGGILCRVAANQDTQGRKSNKAEPELSDVK